MKRELIAPCSGRNYGIIGEETGHGIRKVGDIVAFRVEEKIHTSVVIKVDGMYALLGFPGYSLDSNYFKDMSILVPSKKLQERDLKKHNMSMLEIRNVDVDVKERKKR